MSQLIQNTRKHLYADVKVKSAITAAPFGSFLIALNLINHLGKSKLYLLERKTCDTFSSYVTKEFLKINHHFDCNSKHLIYLMSCKVCGKQYVRSATQRFKFPMG